MDRDEWLEGECCGDTINGTEQKVKPSKANLVKIKFINGEQIVRQQK